MGDLERTIYDADGTALIANNDQAAKEAAGRGEGEMILIGGTDGTSALPLLTDATGKLLSTATLSGDINVDSSSVDTGGYIGKTGGTNADFTITYTAPTQITCSALPTDVASIEADDIVSIDQIALGGLVTNTYTRDDVAITAAASVLTVVGATFAVNDTFVVYTNIAKPSTIESEGTPDAVAAAKVSQMGGIAESAVPTAVADGDAVALWLDTYGRQILAAYDAAQGVDLVQDTSAVTGVPFQPGAWTALAAVGATAPVNITGYKNFGVTIVIATITGATTDERLEVSRDGGTTYVNANLDQGPTGYTRYTANGNYTLEGTNRGYTHMRLYHVAEADAAVTVTGTPFASN